MKEGTPAQITALDVAKARNQAAHRITQRNTLYSAGIGLLPFPVVDAAILLALQLSMLRSIARLYKADFKESLAKSLIGSLAGFVGAAGLIKAIPGLPTSGEPACSAADRQAGIPQHQKGFFNRLYTFI